MSDTDLRNVNRMTEDSKVTNPRFSKSVQNESDEASGVSEDEEDEAPSGEDELFVDKSKSKPKNLETQATQFKNRKKM